MHLPLLAAVGAFFILAGSMSWAWANPLLDVPTLLPMRGVVNAALVAASGALVPLAYTWFATGKPDPLMARAVWRPARSPAWPLVPSSHLGRPLSSVWW